MLRPAVLRRHDEQPRPRAPSQWGSCAAPSAQFLGYAIAERTGKPAGDTARTINRGCIRQPRITALMLWPACLIAVRDQRTLASVQTHHEDNPHATVQPRIGKRRREPASATASPP